MRDQRSGEGMLPLRTHTHHQHVGYSPDDARIEAQVGVREGRSDGKPTTCDESERAGEARRPVPCSSVSPAAATPVDIIGLR
jgi:hypothetical protein